MPPLFFIANEDAESAKEQLDDNLRRGGEWAKNWLVIFNPTNTEPDLHEEGKPGDTKSTLGQHRGSPWGQT